MMQRSSDFKIRANIVERGNIISTRSSSSDGLRVTRLRLTHRSCGSFYLSLKHRSDRQTFCPSVILCLRFKSHMCGIICCVSETLTPPICPQLRTRETKLPERQSHRSRALLLGQGGGGGSSRRKPHHDTSIDEELITRASLCAAP